MARKLRNLRVMQLNVQSLRTPGRLSALCDSLLENAVDVCALQETWLSDTDDVPAVDGYHWHGSSRPGSKNCGGVAFLVRVGVPFSILDCEGEHFRSTQLEMCEIALHSSVGNIRVLNVYCPPKSSTSSRLPAGMCSEIGRHLRNCAGPRETLLLGDLNAHSPVFGANKLNSAGAALETVVADCGLRLLNTNDARTYSYVPRGAGLGAVRWSCPDLGFASPLVANSVAHWKVGPSVGGGPHLPIIFDVAVATVLNPPPARRWRVTAPAMDRFAIACQSPLKAWVCRSPVTADVDSSYRSWRRTVLRLANDEVGRTTGESESPGPRPC